MYSSSFTKITVKGGFMQIANRIQNNNNQNFRANPQAPKRESDNMIPRRMMTSVGTFAVMNIATQLIVKKYKKASFFTPSQKIVDEIIQKGFSAKYLMQDIGIGAAFGLLWGFVENKMNKKSQPRQNTSLHA